MHTIPLPSSLTSRDGWADLLAIRRPSEPHVHQIEPTNHCPYTCIMCPRANKMTRPLGFMEMELYQKIIAEIDGYAEPVRSKEIELFHFGESLLHPRIHEMVGYASGKGLKTVLSVNAPQLTPKIAEAVLENRPHRLIISLDGYDEQSYRQIRGKAADFSKAAYNIKNLISLKRESNSDTQTCIRMIRLELNSGHLDRFVEEWEDNGISVELRPFFPWTERELVPLGDVQKYPPGMPCPFPWQYLVVQWDGTVVPCCRDYNAVNAIGNARRDSLRDIWNGPGYELFRQQHCRGDYGTNTFCSDCMDIFYTEPEGDGCETKFESPHTIRHLWQEAVNNFSTCPLMCSDDDGSVFSYEDAGTIVSILAQRLRSKGIGKGDRVCVCSPIHPEALFAFWASAMLGAVFVPLDYALPKTTLQAIIEEVEPAIIFCDSIRGDLLNGISDCQIVVFDSDDDSSSASSYRFSDWMGEGSDRFLPAVVCEDDPAVILYTSGTSGLPKGVVLSHGALYRSGRLMSASYGWRKDDIFLGLAELHTMSGLRNPAVAAIHCGCAVVVAAHPVRTNALAVV